VSFAKKRSNERTWGKEGRDVSIKITLREERVIQKCVYTQRTKKSVGFNTVVGGKEKIMPTTGKHAHEY